MKTQRTLLRIKEGPAKNYFDAMHLHFGGELGPRSYQVNKASISVLMTSYIISTNLELLVTEGKHSNAIDVDRMPDEDPEYIHINIFTEGHLTQSYDNKRNLAEAGTTKGAFIYNGMFPLKAEFPGNVRFKSISFKFKRRALEEILPEALLTFDSLFGTQEAIAYHFQLPREIERLIDDIFYFRAGDFGNQSMVIARGLEVFTSLFLFAQNHIDKNEMNGLHVDDYQRLLQIKEKLLASFDQKITLEGIANEFGLSVSKLKRDFKILFNCSIYQFYTHAKMDEAFRLLKSGDYSVMQVGYDLGYQNLSKFSEMFKKVKGITPKQVMGIST